MQILMVSEDIPAPGMGGLAKHALALCRALIAAGHTVDLMGNSDFSTASAGGEVQFGGRFFAELKGQFDGWKEMQLGLFMPPKRSRIAQRFARAMLRRAAHYDVIHYHGHLPNVACYIPARVNFIQTRHDQGSDCLIHTRYKRGVICTESDPQACAGCRSWQPNWLQRQCSAMAVRRYRREVATGFQRHKTVFVSGLLQSNLQRSFGQGNWGVTLHNFIDPVPLAAARAAAAPLPQSGILRVFIAAKLYPAKGVAQFLAALMPRLPDWLQLDIAGDGGDEAYLRAQHSHPRLRFHGWQSTAATLALAARAHAVVVPSVWEEPCATTVLEALMLGKTTFALRRGGTPELAAYASAPEQLRLFEDMNTLVGCLLQFRHQPDYALRPALSADAGSAAHALLALYRLPPGPVPC
ncbi:MAG: glycosyltransferase family 4 protein [Burkholderiaceae bacterium]